MIAAAISQFESDLVALESSVDRARRTLGCSYATSAALEATVVEARRRQAAFTSPVQSARVALGATAMVSLATLILLAS